jgi:hypothetical protein
MNDVIGRWRTVVINGQLGISLAKICLGASGGSGAEHIPGIFNFDFDCTRRLFKRTALYLIDVKISRSSVRSKK